MSTAVRTGFSARGFFLKYKSPTFRTKPFLVESLGLYFISVAFTLVDFSPFYFCLTPMGLERLQNEFLKTKRSEHV
jgi:hypothetical protein